MAFRSLAQIKIQTTNTPQPLVGAWITAGIGAPSKVPLTLTLGTALTTNGKPATDIFLPLDWVYLINVDGSNGERVQLATVPSDTTVTINPSPSTLVATQKTHASGVFGTGTSMVLANDANNVFTQPTAGNAGDLYLGNAFNFTPTFRRVAYMAKVASGSQPNAYSASEGFFGAPFPMNELWIYGTANDTYTPVFGTL